MGKKGTASIRMALVVLCIVGGLTGGLLLSEIGRGSRAQDGTETVVF